MLPVGFGWKRGKFPGGAAAVSAFPSLPHSPRWDSEHVLHPKLQIPLFSLASSILEEIFHGFHPFA